MAMTKTCCGKDVKMGNKRFAHIWFGDILITVSISKELNAVYVNTPSNMHISAYRKEIKFIDEIV